MCRLGCGGVCRRRASLSASGLSSRHMVWLETRGDEGLAQQRRLLGVYTSLRLLLCLCGSRAGARESCVCKGRNVKNRFAFLDTLEGQLQLLP